MKTRNSGIGCWIDEVVKRKTSVTINEEAFMRWAELVNKSLDRQTIILVLMIERMTIVNLIAKGKIGKRDVENARLKAEPIVREWFDQIEVDE